MTRNRCRARCARRDRGRRLAAARSAHQFRGPLTKLHVASAEPAAAAIRRRFTALLSASQSPCAEGLARDADRRAVALVAHPLRCGSACRGKSRRFINHLRHRRKFAPHRAVPQTPGRVSCRCYSIRERSFVRDEEGQDLLEYALLVALIALIAIGAVTAAGNSVSTIFNRISGQLNATS